MRKHGPLVCHFISCYSFNTFLVEKLRIEKDDIQAELDNEIDQVALWKQGLRQSSRIFSLKNLEHSISKAAQERQTKDFTTKNQQLAFDLEKMKAENDRLQKQNDLLERERVSNILVFFS